ncbi:hypothetical protein [Rhizobium sp. BK176]|uniref:hypothetical protein n=1 Tax=Rhizobium sp. BK176 TaxID=2587071 RepID=UPI002166F3E9|nr:hypothetical protein [Rhizobium sp. BK176]MCS4088436.1 hypothetical protein [Rhizobium sp. BK176]
MILHTREGTARRLAFPVRGLKMTADSIVEWAIRNDFYPVGERCFRGTRNGSSVSIEIKKASFIVISEGGGKSPRVMSMRFKDVSFDRENDSIVGVPALTPINVELERQAAEKRSSSRFERGPIRIPASR